MKVVATHKGFYGGQVRDVGEEFTIAGRADFSERWMMKAGDPEAKKLAAQTGPSREDQIAQEIAQSEGISGYLREEIRQLKKRNRELTDEITNLRAKLQPATPAEALTDAAVVQPGDDDPAPEPDKNTAEHGEGESKPRRRRRSS